MIILIEGFNETGKSTLATRLSQDLKWPFYKFGITRGDALSYFAEKLEDAIYESENCIFDRCHLSNFAYRNELGGQTLTDEEFRFLDRQFVAESSFLIWLVDSVEDIESHLHLGEHHDDPAASLTHEQIVRIQDRFRDAYASSEIPRKLTVNLRILISENGEVTDAYRSLVNLLAEASLSQVRQGVAHGSI